MNPAVEKILTKYYIRDAKTPRNSPFTFKEDGFYKTLKRVAFEELQKIPKDGTKTSGRITDGLFIFLLISSALSCWVMNNILVKIWCVCASVSLALLSAACHNYLHRKKRMYLFNIEATFGSHLK